MIDIITSEAQQPTQHDFDQSQVVMQFDGYQMAVEIRHARDGSSFLWWSDGVANQWCEHYPTLPHAFGRFAILMECGETGWKKGFEHQPSEFYYRWKHFTDNCITS